jgi:RNA recognition motif-containing protein
MLIVSISGILYISGASMSNKKLYVGSLAYSVNDESLRALFAEVGNVESAKVISDFGTGRSKGFGFVEMSTPEEATTAISKLNGAVHEGRTIIVSEAKPQENRASRGGRGGSAGRGGFGGGNGGGNGGGSRGGFGGGRGRDRSGAFGGSDRY